MKRIEVRYRGQINQAAVELLEEAGLDVLRLRPLMVDMDNGLSGINAVVAAARLLSDVDGILVYPCRDVSALAADVVAIN